MLCRSDERLKPPGDPPHPPDDDIPDDVERFLARGRAVRSRLSGGELLALGVPRGPRVGATLERLRRLRLDGALASDLAVVNGARVSFNQASDEMGERDAGLIRFLMREQHGSPFEHGYFRFIVKAPLFVVREHHRHRAGQLL